MILWRGRADDVETVLVGGRRVVEGGEVTTVDRAALGGRLAADARAAFVAAGDGDESQRLASDLERRVIDLLSGWDWPDPEPEYRYNTK